MRRLLAALAATALTAVPAAAQHGVAPGAMVAMSFSSFAPEHVDVLAGETVTWTNDSVRKHTVTATDGSFDSGTVPIGESFSRRFETPGTFAYYCRLHTFGGSVGVYELLLDAPGGPGGPGRPRTLHGRAALPPGTAVTFEADSGGGFAPVAARTVESDGTLALDVAPRATTAYRAVAGDAVSPPVTIAVVDRRIAVRTRVRGGRTLLDATVRPAAAGTPVALQLHLAERFGWWPVARARLDGRSHARFTLRRRQRVRARVVLTLADGATLTASSRPFTVGR